MSCQEAARLVFVHKTLQCSPGLRVWEYSSFARCEWILIWCALYILPVIRVGGSIS